MERVWYVLMSQLSPHLPGFVSQACAENNKYNNVGCVPGFIHSPSTATSSYWLTSLLRNALLSAVPDIARLHTVTLWTTTSYSEGAFGVWCIALCHLVVCCVCVCICNHVVRKENILRYTLLSESSEEVYLLRKWHVRTSILPLSTLSVQSVSLCYG